MYTHDSSFKPPPIISESSLDSSALNSALNRVKNDRHFKPGNPEFTSYDDYHYPDCSYPDNGNN